LIFSRGIGS